MKNLLLAALIVSCAAVVRAQEIPQCSDWQKSDHSAPACSCNGATRTGDARLSSCEGAAKPKTSAFAETNSDQPSPAQKIAALTSADVNFDGSSSNSELPDAPQPRPEVLAGAPSKPHLAAPSLQKPVDKKIGDDSYLTSSVLFHAAGAFDIASTIAGIKADKNFHEADPVYLAVFGQKNDRNIALITGVWTAGHAGAQVASWALHREADKQGREGHRVKQFLLDGVIVAGNSAGAALHIKEGRTWYKGQGGPL